jgi:tetratricopeptide (TPR) repeat protein
MLNKIFLIICTLLLSTVVVAGGEQKVISADVAKANEVQLLEKRLFEPFIERFILDEITKLNKKQLQIEIDLVNTLAENKLEVTDRSIKFATNTVNNIFYTIAIGTSLLLLFGWHSLKELKDDTKRSVEKRISKLTEEYEIRVLELERSASKRAKEIAENQENIERGEAIQALWKRAGLENSQQERINIYNEIIKLNPHDVEALTYKADVLLELDEPRWAMTLCDEAIAIDNNYGLSYWQRACALVQIGLVEEGLRNIKIAVRISPTLRAELMREANFDIIHDNDDFKGLIGEETEEV